jgi:alkylhydroperoxidase/carboxymuconolactone decarboxylase family protein YurZ
MYDYNPKALEHYTSLRNEILVKGVLSRKDKELILVGINAARRYERSMLYHTKGAVDAGATVEEIVDILSPCILSRGIPAWLEGSKAVKYAIDYLYSIGKVEKAPSINETVASGTFSSMEDVLNYFQQEGAGNIPEWVKLLEAYSPEVVKNYGTLRSGILRNSTVSRKLKELVLVGINVSERYKEGVRIHVASAKKEGATDQEIAEVSLVGVLTAGIPAWFEGSDFLA